jgi:hypothetical protein
VAAAAKKEDKNGYTECMDPITSALYAEIKALQQEVERAHQRINDLRDSHKILVEVMMNHLNAPHPPTQG